MSTTTHQPAMRAFTVIKREGQDDFWLPIGAAFAHQNGEGFNVILQALPIPNGDGQCKIVLRPPKDDEADRQPQARSERNNKSGSRRRYSCSSFLDDIKQPANGERILRSLMMISWAAGYTSAHQSGTPRADPRSIQATATILGEACRKEPTMKVVQVIDRIVQQALIGKLPIANAKDGTTPVASQWEENGSILYLTSDGPRRRLYYESPRADLVDIGVKKGTLAFEGKKVGNKYEGSAYEFARSCKPRAYDVNGDVSTDEKQITIQGRAPQVSTSCAVVGYRDVSRVLTFIPDGQN